MATAAHLSSTIEVIAQNVRPRCLLRSFRNLSCEFHQFCRPATDSLVSFTLLVLPQFDLLLCLLDLVEDLPAFADRKRDRSTQPHLALTDFRDPLLRSTVRTRRCNHHPRAT